MVRKIIEDGEGGHGEDAFLLHQAHGLIAELCAVVDRRHAGLRRIERARLAHGVDADVGAEALRFLDRRGQLRLGVLVGRVQHAVDHASGPVS